MERIKLRRVERFDKTDIFLWRNDKTTRKMSFDSRPLSRKEHDIWFKKATDSDKKILYIGENEIGRKIGVVSFYKVSKGIYEINVNIAPQYRGQGLGKLSIEEGCMKLFRERKVKEIIANIKIENIASIKVFTKAGFDKAEERDNIIEMCFSFY